MCLLLTLLACYDPLYGVPLDDSAGSATVEEPSFNTDILPLFERSCGSGCHTAGAKSGGLSLDAGYAALVAKPASGAPSYNLIEPGDPYASYIWLKVEGSFAEVGGTGAPMPLGASLPDSDRQTLLNWIEQGAKP